MLTELLEVEREPAHNVVPPDRHGVALLFTVEVAEVGELVVPGVAFFEMDVAVPGEKRKEAVEEGVEPLCLEDRLVGELVYCGLNAHERGEHGVEVAADEERNPQLLQVEPRVERDRYCLDNQEAACVNQPLPVAARRKLTQLVAVDRGSVPGDRCCSHTSSSCCQGSRGAVEVLARNAQYACVSHTPW